MKPVKSVLKYEFGDDIALTEADFVARSDAFFAAIEKKYSWTRVFEREIRWPPTSTAK